MWFVLLRLQPWKGLLESGRKQKISDLDSTFHALYAIIRWSHRGACGTHRGRKWGCSPDGLTLSWGTSGILGRRRVCQDLLSALSRTLGPGVRRVCLQGLGDRHATSFRWGCGVPFFAAPTCACPGTCMLLCTLLGCLLCRLSLTQLQQLCELTCQGLQPWTQRRPPEAGHRRHHPPSCGPLKTFCGQRGVSRQ